MKPGKLITIEGGEGVGKTTCLRYLGAEIQRQGMDLWQTREPGGTALGEALRHIALGHEYAGMTEKAELLLMFAARAEHIHRKILPALQAGQWVLCDRFIDATYAYQGGGRGLPQDRIQWLENWVQAGLTPDLTLLMDMPVKQGLKRARQRSVPDRVESESISFFEQVRQAYLARAAQEPERIKVIDASCELDDVEAQVMVVLGEFFARHT